MAHPDRVARVVILNTLLYAPGGTPSPAWRRFRDHVARSDRLRVGRLVRRATATGLDDAEAAAYDAPFPSAAAQAGALALPLRVPLADDDPGADAMWRTDLALASWRHPTLLMWGADDPILPVEVGERWARHIPGARDLVRLSPAGHFLQEDAGPRIGARIAAFATT